jgi:phage host-nuclease inhibitor protein Gam
MVALRKKAMVDVPASYEEADDLLRHYGELAGQLNALEAALSDEVAALTAKIEDQATPIRELMKLRGEQIHAYAEAHRDALLTDGLKHHAMPAGVIGWRNLPPSVDLKSGWTVQKVAEAIVKLRKARQFLRLKWALNKEAMLDDPVAAKELPGIRIKTDEEVFYFEPNSATLSGGAP